MTTLDTYQNSMYEVRTADALSGKFSYYTEEGGSQQGRNEDVLYLNAGKNLFGLFDGMGGVGRGNGQWAAEDAAIYLRKATQNLNLNQTPTDEIKEAVQTSINQTLEKLVVNGIDAGVAYAIFDINRHKDDDERKVHVYEGGDVKLYLVDKEGEVSQLSTVFRDNLGNLTKGAKSNIPLDFEFNQHNYQSYPVQEGQRIVAMSDGVWDNQYVDIESLLKETRPLDSEEATNRIIDSIKGFWDDNVGIIVYDVGPEPEF